MTPDLLLGIALGVMATLVVVRWTLRDVNLRARLPVARARDLPDALPLHLARLRLVASDGSLEVPPARKDFDPPEAA